MSSDTLDCVDEMLKNPDRLTESELEWVERIDRTMASYTDPSPTQRQAEVILDIYRRFLGRHPPGPNQRGALALTAILPESISREVN